MISKLFGRRDIAANHHDSSHLTANGTTPTSIENLVQSITFTWDAPGDGQLQTAFEAYQYGLSRSCLDLESDLEHEVAHFSAHAQSMVELAPDLFDQVLQGTDFEAVSAGRSAKNGERSS